MVKGKSICKLLKDIRQQIADANGTGYQPKECHHEGNCTGTYPACEEEVCYLERELKARKDNGFGMKATDIAAGIYVMVIPITTAAQGVKPDSAANYSVHTAKKDSVKVVDLSEGCASSVVVRGMVIDGDDKEPSTGVFILIEETNKGVVTNIDGLFALKPPPDTSLVVSFIGYKQKTVSVSSLLCSDNNAIVLEAYDVSVIVGGVGFVPSNYDDVYGHRIYGPKPYKEKNKKKYK